LIAKSRPVLEALGATSDETKIVIRSFMAKDRENGGAPGQAREIARKVMVTREIAGIPVEGERIILSYSLDGSLRKVSGVWHPIDFDKSRFSTESTDTQITEGALKRIEDESLKSRLGISGAGKVKIRTVLVPIDGGAGRTILVPQGRVDVPVTGPQGAMTMVLDFAL
jgi:hypothetical protein